jgi:hypothetical protein
MNIDMATFGYAVAIYLVIYVGALLYLAKGARFPKGYYLVGLILTYSPQLAFLYLIIIVFLRERYLLYTKSITEA